MAEYINKKAAIKAIEGLHDCYNGFSDTYDKACIVGALEEIAPADVEPVRHGRWIEGGYACGETEWICSECGFSEWRTSNSRMKFCMNCGARMDGEQDYEITE